MEQLPMAGQRRDVRRVRVDQTRRLRAGAWNEKRSESLEQCRQNAPTTGRPGSDHATSIKMDVNKRLQMRISVCGHEPG